MQRKIFLLISMLFILAFLLTVSIGAASEVIDGITYSLNGNGYASVTNANRNCEKETVIIPDTVTGSDGKEYIVNSIDGEAFRGNKNIKYVSISKNLTSIGAAAFLGCSNLVFVDFNDNQNSITSNSYGIFKECTSLKAICLPDGMSVIPDQAFAYCTNLTAVYLPARLEKIRGNKGDGPAFGANVPNNACRELFFVNEKFEVRDENGSFYTAENFEIPEKPEIYFFPSGLKFLSGSHNASGSFIMTESGMVTNTGSDDCGIQFCPNLNSVLVLPEGFCGYDDRVISNNEAQVTDFRGDTVTNGLFMGCGSEKSPTTIVFMGKVDRVSMSRNGNSHYLTYMFANPANTSFENTKIGTFYGGTNTNYTQMNESYVIFCHANNGLGAKYSVTFVGSEENKAMPVLSSTLVEGVNSHIVNPRIEPYTKEATCIENEAYIIPCLCGNPYTKTETENTALGHNLKTIEGAVDKGIFYTSYMEDGVHKIECARCKEIQENKTPAIFVYHGYSVTEAPINGSYSMAQSYAVNTDALEEYRILNPQFEFGLVASGYQNPLSQDADESRVINIPSEEFAYDYFEIKVRGIGENIMSKAIVFCLYVIDTDTYYLDNNTTAKDVDGISFEDLYASLHP